MKSKYFVRVMAGFSKRSPLRSSAPRSADLDELHKLAERIGLKRSWLDNRNPDHPHYDLTEEQRAAAILAGAEPVTWDEAVIVVRARRVMIGAANG